MTGIDLGAIVRAASEEYLATHTTSSDQRKALRAIAACRTEALGGEKQQCDRCGFEHIVWHSCRNRHCPRCQANARAQWLEERREELLPVPYFHVVFTIPEELNILALWAPRVLYDAMLAVPARRCSRWAAASSGSSLAHSAFCTPGGRRSRSIRTSTAWSLEAGSPLGERSGDRSASLRSFFR